MKIGAGLRRVRAPENASLREQLLVRLLTPVVLVTLISSVISYYYAFNYATLAYDYSLYDSALDISRQVHVINGQLRVDLPRAALDMLESDKHDNIYYMVNDSQGRFITGYHNLPLPKAGTSSGKPVYYDDVFLDNPIRATALSIPVAGLPPEQDHLLIVVAETLNKRRTLAREILFGMLLPELLLVGLIGLLIWYGVARGLRPLIDLQSEISSRSHRDMSPLPVQNAPGEVRALVGAMNELLSRLADALAAQQRFIADAAHQLRTPLAGLRTQTELALRQDDQEEVRKSLRQIDTATARTTHLVNQLLSLARAEPGANRLYAPQPLDLNELAPRIDHRRCPASERTGAPHDHRMGAARHRPQHRSRLRRRRRSGADRRRPDPAQGTARQPARQCDPLHAPRRPDHGRRHATRQQLRAQR